MNEKYLVDESRSTSEEERTAVGATRKTSLSEQASIMARLAREKLEELESINAELELMNRRNTSGQ